MLQTIGVSQPRRSAMQQAARTNSESLALRHSDRGGGANCGVPQVGQSETFDLGAQLSGL